MILQKNTCIIAISGLQHLAFCKRQWGIVHLECEWAENFLTAEGRLMHERVDSNYLEFRSGVRQYSGLHVRSMELGLYGRLDVLEVERNDCAGKDIPWIGLSGNWQMRPVEFKHGKPKDHDADLVQLCAQSLCLEEMTGLKVPEGFIYYCEIRRRQEFEFTNTIRERTIALAKEAHELLVTGVLPSAEKNRNCRSCSLLEFCQPRAKQSKKLSLYRKELFE